MSNAILANLPNGFKERIEPRLKDKTTIAGEKKTFFDALIYGVDFKLRDTVWNVKVAGDADKTFIRLSSKDTLHAYLFENNGSKIRHCQLLISPLETKEEPLPASFDCYPASCSHNFFFAEVILSGECLEPASPERIPKAVHAVATEWFKKHSPRVSYLIPLTKYVAPKTSEFNPLTEKVDDEIFKKIFKVLGIIAAAYFVYRVVIQLFQPKMPAPVPPDAPPAVLVI